MKELLTEFLAGILTEKQKSKAAQDAELQNLEKKPGVGLYGPKGQDIVTHRSVGGQLVAVGQKEPVSTDRSVDQPVPKFGSMGRDPEAQAVSQQFRKDLQRRSTQGKQEPVTTPSGNKISKVLSPKKLSRVSKKVDTKVDEKRSVSDDLADVDVTQHQDRKLPVSSEDYYKLMKERGFVTEPIQRFDDQTRQILRTAGVPDAHVELLERSINTRLDGDIPPFTALTGGATGAGKPPSQAGEILAMTLMAVPSNNRGVVADVIANMVKNSGTDSPILDKSWVDAGIRQAEAFDSMMDVRHGKGNWTVESTAWDTPEDIAGIGLDKENKGFSTDVALRIRVKDKPRAQVARLSLKKDGSIFLLNGTTMDVITYTLQTLSPEERQTATTIQDLLPKIDKDETARKKMEQVLGVKEGTSKKALRELAKQRVNELQDKAMDLLPVEIRRKVEIVSTFSERQQASAEKLSTQFTGRESIPDKVVSSVAKNNKWSVRDAEFARTAHAALVGARTVEEAKEALKKAGIPADKEDRFRKAVVYAATLEAERDPAMKSDLDKHFAMAVECGNASLDATLEDENMMTGLMVKLQETFPIRVIATGEESMCLGGVPVSRETLTEMFGTSDPDEIQQGLTVATNPGPPEERILIFQSEGPTGRRVPIASVRARQRGKGYEGTVGLEFKATPQFECAAAAANAKVGMNGSANQRIVAKCAKKSKEK